MSRGWNVSGNRVCGVICVYPGFCVMKMFENQRFRQSKTAGRQPAFSSSELNTAQHGFDRLSACMLSLWNYGTISPCSWRERKRIDVTAVNKYEDDGEVNHGRCKNVLLFLFFSPLNLVNFEVVIANLIRELCDESLTAKCVSVLVQRSSLIRTENMSYAVLTQLWASSQLWRREEKSVEVITIITITVNHLFNNNTNVNVR